ncbi:MAG: helix-turn-helix transcriptional regulator, partial [Chloroflexota bacterium]
MEEEISFGRFLKTRRKTLDLTQETLAQQVGCAVITIRKFESETRRPSQQMAARLADVLDLSDEERDTFIHAARQHIHHDPEEQEVYDSEEEDLDYSEDTEFVSREPPEVVQVPATSSNITLTISKSRLLWVLTIGLGTLVMISVIVWFYGLTGGVSSIVQLASPDSEHREG